MRIIKVFLILLILLKSGALFSQQILVLDSAINEISLSNYAYHYNDQSNNKKVEEVINEDWQKIEPPLTFPSNKTVQWIKYNIENPYNVGINRYLYIPYHFIHEIDVFILYDSIVHKIIETGTKRNFSNKHLYSRGYPVKISFSANNNYQVIIKYKHIYRPLRAAAFIMSSNKMVQVNRKSEQIIWFWRGVFVFALIVSFLLFLYVKQKVFLYYFFLNIGVGVFIASHIGDYFLFFNVDKTDLTSLADYFGAALMNVFLPLFINSLTPIKKRNPFVWKLIYIIGFGMVILLALSAFPVIRMSIMNYYTHFYIMLGSAFIMGVQPFLLIKAIYYKEKNAKLVFIIYGLYVSSAFSDVILPNMGILNDTPFVYDNLLLSSFLEIFTFMFIMSREAMSVYQDRQKLLIEQQQHQSQMIQSIVKSQEEERNRVGRELHDSLGANMAIIKQHVKKSNDALFSVVSESIEMVRNLSHSLVTPHIKKEEFKDELKELCHLFSGDSLKVQYFFYEWPSIENADITTHLYRIIQELLKNAIKHSQAKNVYLQFMSDGEQKISIIYEDDGIGFNHKKNTRKGLGLNNIKNRLELINGNMRFDTSKETKGTTIFIELEL